MQKYVIALYIRLSIEDYKYDIKWSWHRWRQKLKSCWIR